MMEAQGPSSPFDFDINNHNGDFNLSEFVTSPPDNNNNNNNNDDFMAAFSLDGAPASPAQHSSSSFHQDPNSSSSTTTTDYPPMTISQLQQLHSQIQQQSSPSGSASPSVHLSGPPPPPPPQPSESELQSILDGLISNNNVNSQPQGLVDAAGNMDLGSLMGQLAGMGQQHGGNQHQHEGPSAFTAPPPPPPQLQQGQDESTATALQRLQQLQQLQQYQSQFIQQQLDNLTRQAAEQQLKNQQQQLHFQAQPPQHSSHHLQSQKQQQQQHANHFRSHSLDQSNSNLVIHQGLPTPAHSSELYATMHQEMVSPIHLPGGAAGRYRDSNEYDLDGNLLFTPLMSPAMSQSNQTTPGSAYQPINSLTHTPSADFFSPLTSPALGPVFHSSDYNRVSNSHLQNQNNHSHNPPSMSPHLLAQNSSMSMSPHLLAQQSGMMPPGSPAQKRSTSSSGKSRSSRGTGSSATGAGGPEGKHAKARPSPLMKPIASTSRRKKDSLGGSMPSPRLPLMSPQLPMDGIGEMEISESSGPSSSSNNYFSHQSPSSYGQQNHLIPSAIPSNVDQGSSGSNSSPSPVDLASLQMPPPPVPTPQQRRLSASSNYSNGSGASSMVSSIAPQTPATFLNLSRAGHSGSINSSASSSTTAMNSTPVNPSPLSSPFISATDSSTYGNGNGNGHGHHLPTNGVNGGGAKVPPQASSSSSNASRGVSNTYKPPFIAPVAKGKTPGAAPKGARKSKAAAHPKPPPSTSKPEPSSTSGSSNKPPEVRKTSHREAEQRRRDSLKAGFDELRVLLPPINVEAFDPDTGEPIAGASMPRLPARSPLIPDDNPNRGVSKVALLRCSNKHIGLLNGRIERRDALIEKLRKEVRDWRSGKAPGGGAGGEGEGEEQEEWEDALEVDVDFVERDDEEYDEEEEEEEGGEEGEEAAGGLGEAVEEDELHQEDPSSKKSRRPSTSRTKSSSSSSKPAPRTSMGRAAAAVASAKLREGGGEDEDDEGGEGMDQS